MTQSPSPIVDEVAGLEAFGRNQIIAELQQAVSNWQRRAYAAEDELKRLTSASGGPLSVDESTLHPLADREKSAASLVSPPKAGAEELIEHEISPGLQKVIDDTKGKIREAFRETPNHEARGDGVREAALAPKEPEAEHVGAEVDPELVNRVSVALANSDTPCRHADFDMLDQISRVAIGAIAASPQPSSVGGEREE